MPRAGRLAFLTLDLATLRARLPLDNDRPTLPAHQPLGALAVLPNELLCEILANVDIAALTTFRRANRAARAAVDSIPEYATLVKSHPDVLRAVVASSATSYTCRDLHAELQNTKCRKCSAEATHVYLITCHLVCRRCFGGPWRRDVPPKQGISRASRAKYGAAYPYPSLLDPNRWHPVLGLLREFEEYVPLQEEHVLEHCKGITSEELKEAPHILSLPAWYWDGDQEVSTGPRVKLYDAGALLARHKLEECYCMRNYPDVMRRYQAVIALRETEEEAAGDVPIGAVGDPFAPSYRDYHWN